MSDPPQPSTTPRRIVLYDQFPRVHRRHLEIPVLVVGEEGENILRCCRDKTMAVPMFPASKATTEMVAALEDAWRKTVWTPGTPGTPFQLVMFSELRELRGEGVTKVGLVACAVKEESFSNSSKPVRLFPFECYRKVTELNGFYATHDHECFCFGRFAGPTEHHKYMEEHHPFPQKPEEGSEEVQQARSEALAAFQQAEDKLRVYPGSLLPPQADERKGRWRFTVEFWPQETVDTEKSG